MLVVLAILGGLAWLATRAQQAREGEAANDAEPPASSERSMAAPQDINQILRVEAIELRLGSGLCEALAGEDSDLMDRIDHLRRQFAQDLGFVMPRVQQQLRTRAGLGSIRDSLPRLSGRAGRAEG